MTEQHRQQELISGDKFKPPGYQDYKRLPNNVIPTSVKWLVQGGDWLYIREADDSRWISPKQHSIFRSAVLLGEIPDSPTGITVLAISGLQGVTQRTMSVYDAMNVSHSHRDRPKRMPLARGDDAIADFIGDWFDDRKGRR